MIFPVFHLFNFLLRDKTFKIIRAASDNPLKTECICLSDGKRYKAVVVNFTSGKPKVIFQGFSGEFRIKQLNSETFADAAFDQNWSEKNWQVQSINGGQLNLEPYSVSFIDGNI